MGFTLSLWVRLCGNNEKSINPRPDPPITCAPHPAPSRTADIILDALRFACGKQWMAVAVCVVMPDHLHLLLQHGREKVLPALLGDLFRFTAREINRVWDRTGTLWQAGYFEHAALYPDWGGWPLPVDDL